jgi:hypothetical protein
MASSGCVSFRSAYLYPEDVALLATRAWLNDSVLGLWCEAAEAGAAGGAHVVCMQPAAVRLLRHETDAGDLAALAAALRLPAAAAVLLPVSDAADASEAAAGSHWTLLAWARGAGFAHFDSCGRGAASPNGAAAAHLAAVLAPLLGAGAAGAAVAQARCPAQRNAFDCGVHVAWAMEALALHAAAARQGGWAAALSAAAAGDGDVEAAMAAYRVRMLAFARAHAVGAAAAVASTTTEA